MKQVQIKYSLFAILLILSITSCTKEEITQQNDINNHEDYSIRTGLLDWCGVAGKDKEISQWICFNTTEAYEEMIYQYSDADSVELEELRSMLNFSSMAIKYNKRERDSLGVTDDFFASILSSDGVIQIEDYVLHMDFIDSTVQILHLPDSAVINENTNLDFFDFLDSQKEGSKGGHYRSNEAEHKVWVEQDVDTELPGVCTVCKLKYEKSVVYFCIKTVINNTYMPNWFGGGHFGDMVIDGGPDIYINVPSGSSSTGNGYYTTNKRNATRQYISGYTIGGYNHTYSKKVYSGARGLKEFKIKADFSWNVNSGSYGSKSLTIIRSNQ